MKKTKWWFAVLCVGLLAGGLAGCGEGGGGGADKATIAVSYVRPAAVDVPPAIKKVAIAEFSATNQRDERYGEIASDKLASQLDEANREHGRYVLVDRRNLKKIMDERDLQVAISDTGTAVKAGQLAGVDAVIYGSVKARAEHVQATKTEFRMGPRGMPQPVEKRYMKLVVTANINFTLDDIHTGGTIVTKSFDESYDSDKDKGNSNFTALFGLEGKADRKSEIEAANVLIDKCVRKFVNLISPVTVNERYKLAKGKSKLVASGNKMAAAGDYEGATENYKEALASNPADDAACYNLGLMCEAQGKLKEALEYYRKAVRLNGDNVTYIDAQKRVRGALSADGAAPANGSSPDKNGNSKKNIPAADKD